MSNYFGHLLFVYERTDQQREATADVLLAVDFLRQEYADQLGANYSEVSSIPMLLARLRRPEQRQTDPAHPEVVSADPTGASPAANPVATTPPLRHGRRRRPRRGEIQQPDVTAVASTPADASRAADDRRRSTGFDEASARLRDRWLTTEASITATHDGKDEALEELGEKLVDEREDYAERLLKIAHGLHYGSIAILSIFVLQVIEHYSGKTVVTCAIYCMQCAAIPACIIAGFQTCSKIFMRPKCRSQ